MSLGHAPPPGVQILLYIYAGKKSANNDQFSKKQGLPSPLERFLNMPLVAPRMLIDATVDRVQSMTTCQQKKKIMCSFYFGFKWLLRCTN